MTTLITQDKKVDGVQASQLVTTIDSAKTTGVIAGFPFGPRAEMRCDPATCQHRVDVRVTLRPVSGQVVVMGPPQVRCRLQTPEQSSEAGSTTVPGLSAPRLRVGTGILYARELPIVALATPDSWINSLQRGK